MIKTYETTQLCVMCADAEVQIVVNSTGAGYCSAKCEGAYYAEDEMAWTYDIHPQEDYEPSVYDGTYSEE